MLGPAEPSQDKLSSARQSPFRVRTPSIRNLENPLSLQVERPLVLEPPPVVTDAADLLSIVVRDRVAVRARCRVDPVLLDALEEFLLLLSPELAPA